MPKYEHPDLGDVQDHVFIKATILAVNSENDTADIEGEGIEGSDVPIFYHCEPDSEERSNGAIYGAAGGFLVDDEVYVMCEGAAGSYTPVRIVGFVDGVKSCLWEPWDASDTPNLCLNHPWKAYNTEHSWVSCPADLYSGEYGSYTFAEGKIGFSGLYPAGGVLTIGHAALRWRDDLTTVPASGVVECHAAITVTRTDSISSNVLIQIWDSDGDRVDTYLTSASMDVPTVIDLSALNGEIVDVYIIVYTRGGSNTAFLLDYINFK